MTIDCQNPIHPLEHHGTHQRHRLLQALIPENLKLDDRTIAGLVAFADELASHVRFFDPANQNTGDWTTFWHADATTLLAIIASTDQEAIRTAYRSQELTYLSLKKAEERQLTGVPDSKKSENALEELVINPEFGLFGMALRILDICGKTPAGHPLRKEIAGIISEKLREPFYRLIQFHKAIEKNALEKYGGFIGTGDCSSPWGLKNKGDFQCIDFILPYDRQDELWELFLAFYRALNLIVNKAAKAFQAALRNRRDHQPHIALFLSFLQLFRYLQSDFNQLTEKHLIFYYRDILSLQARGIIPDKVHIVFEVAKNLERYRLEKGTLLKGGTDAQGKQLLYKLADELVVSKAKLVEKPNLYVTEVQEPDSDVKKIFAIGLPAADMKDGIEEPFPAGLKAWRAFSGKEIYEEIEYKSSQLIKILDAADAKDIYNSRPLVAELAKVRAKLNKLQAFTGLTISTPELWLEKANLRIISIDIDFGLNSLKPLNLLDYYTFEISTEEGMRTLSPYPIEIEDPRQNLTVAFNPQLSTHAGSTRSILATSRALTETPSTSNRVAKIADRQSYLIVLYDEFPSVKPITDLEPPFIRLRSRGYGFDLLSGRISSVTLFTISLTSNEHSTLGASPFDLHRPPGSGLREYESGDRLAITPKNEEQSVFIRSKELFAKDIAGILLDNRTRFLSGRNYALLNSAWETLPFLIESKGGEAGKTYAYAEEETLHIPEEIKTNNLNANPNGWLRFSFKYFPEQEESRVPALLSAEDFGLVYLSNELTIPVNDLNRRNPSRHQVLYYTSLGEWIPPIDSPDGFRSTPEINQPKLLRPFSVEELKNPPAPAPANGNLFLGFENLQPGQTLSLLFKTAAGTGNPEHFAPEIIWSYLKSNEWVQLPPQFILKDETLQMKQTGIIRFQIPGDINNGNTWIKGKDGRKDLYWLRASATEIPEKKIYEDALPMLEDIHVNAETAIFEDNNNSHEHLLKGLPAETIAALRFNDVNISQIEQPYDSFGGLPAEEAARHAYYRRISERLRHKNRAVTIWDYERLVLENFPKTAVVKCLSHSYRTSTAHPGFVTLAVIPYPDQMIGSGKFYPILDAGDLETIRVFINRLNSYFVGGYGHPGFCCCDGGDPCTCGPPDRLIVMNPRFEPIRLKVCVRFKQGLDIPSYKKELNEALKSFLAPWATDQTQPLLFGASVHLTRLLQFLESLDYVDVVMSIAVKHFADRESSENNEAATPWTKPAKLEPFTSASVLTTYLDRLNKDNPNVIDHEIAVIEDHDHCTCIDCEESPLPAEGIREAVRGSDTPKEKPSAATAGEPEPAILEKISKLKDLWKAEPNTANIIREFKKDLDLLVDANILFGEKISDPKKGVEGRDAYKIDTVKEGNKITALIIGLTTAEGQPFKTYTVSDPKTEENK